MPAARARAAGAGFRRGRKRGAFQSLKRPEMPPIGNRAAADHADSDGRARLGRHCDPRPAYRTLWISISVSRLSSDGSRTPR